MPRAGVSESRGQKLKVTGQRGTPIRSVILLIFGIVFSCTVASEVFAADFEAKGPLPIRSQNPIYLQYLNLTPTRAKVLPKGEAEVRIDNTYSNVFEQGVSSTNSVLLDMEILRTALQFNYGVFEDMELGVEIPFLHFDGGFLDAFIQKYHNFFGFPNGGRENVPNGEFHYYFTKNGSTIYNVPELNFGLSDISLNFKYNVVHEEALMPAISWMFYFKIPTGKPSRGTGSGSPDFGFGAALEKSYKRLHGYFNAAYFVDCGMDNPMQDYIYNYYFSYLLGGGLSVSRVVDLVVQLNGGTPLLNGTNMTPWDSFPMDIQFGVRGENDLARSETSKIRAIEWMLGFTEDINPDGPSIDFTVFASIGMKFRI